MYGIQRSEVQARQQISPALIAESIHIHLHRAPVPEPIEEPLPGEHPVPQEEPIPSPNPQHLFMSSTHVND